MNALISTRAHKSITEPLLFTSAIRTLFDLRGLVMKEMLDIMDTDSILIYSPRRAQENSYLCLYR